MCELGVFRIFFRERSFKSRQNPRVDFFQGKKGLGRIENGVFPVAVAEFCARWIVYNSRLFAWKKPFCELNVSWQENLVSWKDRKCQYKLLLKTLIELEVLSFRGKPPKFACRYGTRAVGLSSPRITRCIKTQARTPRFLRTNFDTKLILKLLLTTSVTYYSIGNTVNFKFIA